MRGATNHRDDYPYWMDIAQGELGQAEISGTASHNARIQEYLKEANLAGGDETPWCSAFVNWVMKKAGYSRTSMPNARSWLGWGIPIAYPKFGAITVFMRNNADGSPSGWKGHVALFRKSEGSKIYVLGGNQGDKVSIAGYPRTRLLGYRWPYELDYDKHLRESIPLS